MRKAQHEADCPADDVEGDEEEERSDGDDPQHAEIADLKGKVHALQKKISSWKSAKRKCVSMPAFSGSTRVKWVFDVKCLRVKNLDRLCQNLCRNCIKDPLDVMNE